MHINKIKKFYNNVNLSIKNRQNLDFKFLNKLPAVSRLNYYFVPLIHTQQHLMHQKAKNSWLSIKYP